ncbi:MAG: hypothetical protein Q7U04_17760 [Bacteriovorax sp.]|nr:hypothetical protein [Bacteriovorax sp.]
MKTITLLLVSSLVIPIIGNAADSIRPSKLILSTFSSQCSQVVTNEVGGSLGTLQILYGIVEELKNDKDCSGVTQLSNAITRYGHLYDDFQTQSNSSQDKLILEKKISLYSTLVGNPNLSADQLSYLNTEIIQSQANLVSIKSGLTRFQSYSGREARGADEVVHSLDNFLQNLSQDQNSACYKKHGAQISSLVSNALLITASFAAPGASLALAAGSVVVSSIGSYVENFKYNKTLTQASDIEMPIALRCISQALTDQYCNADATKSLINDRLNNSSKPQARYEGISLLSYQLSSLSKWLEEVYAGSEITSQGDLINREKPIQQAEFLKKVKRYIETYGTIKTKVFENIDNDSERSLAIAKAIEGLAIIMDNPSLNPKPKNMYSDSSSDLENPIFLSNSQPLMPFTLWKTGELTIVPPCGQTLCTLEAYLAEKGITLQDSNWSQALINANRILQLTIERINIERAKTISVDAYSIMVNAKRDLKGEVNPYLALKKITDNAERIGKYLTNLGCKSNSENCSGMNNRYFPQISNIEKTKQLTLSVIKLVEESTIPRTLVADIFPIECRNDKTLLSLSKDNTTDDFEKKSFQITSCISKILKLEERGTDVYFSKIRNMVSYEMEARLANNDLGNGLENIITSTKEDLLQSILNSYASNNSSLSINDLETGLETAQNSTKETLNVFFDFFKEEVLTAFKNDKIGVSPKADLCFRILPYLNESNQSMMKDVYEACVNAKKISYKDGPSIIFTNFIQKIDSKNLVKKSKYVFKNNINEREKFCAYSDFHSASILYDEQIRMKDREQSIKIFSNHRSILK